MGWSFPKIIGSWIPVFKSQKETPGARLGFEGVARRSCPRLGQGNSVAAQVGPHVDGGVPGSQQQLHLVALQVVHGALRDAPIWLLFVRDAT